MTFIFQQPGTARLLEAINNAAENACCGGGVFAFASTGGIDALFACPNFSDMLNRKRPFHLIVGIDAITNAEALLSLADRLGQFETLTVNIFFHEQPRSTFHPKFSWFGQGGTLHLLTGSGNMTLRGLGQITDNHFPSGNWEAFSVQSLEEAEAVAVNRQIEDWLNEQHSAGTLCSLDDARVLDRAMTNGRMRFAPCPIKTRRPTTPVPPQAQEEKTAPVDGVEFETPEVLIRELPENRSGQADVGKKTLEQFFGYKGEAKNVLIQHVSNANELEPALQIRLFVNKSKNYRLELRAIAELEYITDVDDSRMVLIATKFDRRSFRYTIVPVTAPGYRQILTLCGGVPTPQGNSRRRMREKLVSPEELLATWPDAPSNLLPLNLETPEP